MMAAAEKEVVFHAVDGRAEELVLEHGPVHGDVFVVLDVIGGGGGGAIIVVVIVTIVVARLIGRSLVAAIEIAGSPARRCPVLILQKPNQNIHLNQLSFIRHLVSSSPKLLTSFMLNWMSHFSVFLNGMYRSPM